MEYDSPFDAAVARPLLGEPVKKRWIWWNLSSGENPQQEEASKTLDLDYRDAPAPVMEIEFDSSEQEAVLMLEIMEEGSLGEDLDTAMMRERHNGIQGVHSAMMQLNEIQKDLAAVVEWQSDHVDELEQNVVDAAAQAATGMSHLQALHERNLARRQRRRERLLALAGFAVALAGTRWLAHHTWEDNDSNGATPQGHVP